MDITKIRCLSDNVLLRFASHANARGEERQVNGIFIPKIAETPKANEAIEAIVVAAGPGRYLDKWLDHELGTDSVGSPVFVPMGVDIMPGARVLLNAQGLAGDRLYADDRSEYRMVKESCIEAVLENE